MMREQRRALARFARVPTPVQGALLMTGAALGFSIMNGLIRLAAEELEPLQIAFFRNFFALVVMLPWLLRVGWEPLRGRHARLYLTRAGFGYLAMACWFFALAFLPLAEAVSLTFTAPLFVTAGAAILLGELVGWRRWSATAIGFLGVLVIIRPGFAEVSWATGLPILAALFMAITSLLVKTLSRTQDSRTIVLYLNLFLAPVSLLPALFVWQWPSLPMLLVVALVGIASVAAQLLLTLAFARTEASIAVPFLYTQLPFIVTIGVVFFGEWPDGWTLAGAGIIIGCAIYIAQRESRITQKKPGVDPKAPSPCENGPSGGGDRA